MISAAMAGDILATGVTVVAIGDPGQLPPINANPFFTRADFLLTEIHRQALESGVVRQAHAVRDGGLYAPDGDEVRVVASLADADLRAADIILTERRTTRMAMNAKVREVLGCTSPLPRYPPGCTDPVPAVASAAGLTTEVYCFGRGKLPLIDDSDSKASGYDLYWNNGYGGQQTHGRGIDYTVDGTGAITATSAISPATGDDHLSPGTDNSAVTGTVTLPMGSGSPSGVSFFPQCFGIAVTDLYPITVNWMSVWK